MVRAGHAVALCALALLVLGVVMVNSAAMSLSRHEAVTVESIVMSRSSMYMVLAMFAMGMAALLPVRRLVGALERDAESGAPASVGSANPFSWFSTLLREWLRLWPLWVAVGALLVVLASVYVPGIARPMNGAHRWINLKIPGFDSIQPSELAKWGLVIVIAWYGARFSTRMRTFWLGLAPGLAAAGAVAAFIVLEDLGTGALIGAVACVMLLAAGARWWHLLALLPLPAAGVTLAIVTSPYRMNRIHAFFDPYGDALGKGFHSIQSMAAVANGEGAGRGLGFGLQKFGYLPEDTTDFLFAVICEELGIAGAALVVALFAGLIWALWSIVKREESPLLKLVALGVMATIGLQALINLAVVTGLGPTKGIALPMLSSGGTGWVLTSAALGLVIAIHRSQPSSDVGAPCVELDDEPDASGNPAHHQLEVQAPSTSVAGTSRLTASTLEPKPARSVAPALSATGSLFEQPEPA